MREWIVCGWYTPDYEKWAAGLAASLDEIAAPHDIVCVPKAAGGWEVNTCQKPAQLLAAMDRHHGKVIIFVDADAVARGDLSPLASLDGDIAFCPWKKFRSGQAWMQPQSGTIVANPTPNARRFVEKWMHMNAEREFGENDQSTFVRALNACPGLMVHMLEPHWCTRAGYMGSPAIVHLDASNHVPKIRNFQRFLHAIGWRGPDLRHTHATRKEWRTAWLRYFRRRLAGAPVNGSPSDPGERAVNARAGG